MYSYRNAGAFSLLCQALVKLCSDYSAQLQPGRKEVHQDWHRNRDILLRQTGKPGACLMIGNEKGLASFNLQNQGWGGMWLQSINTLVVKNNCWWRTVLAWEQMCINWNEWVYACNHWGLFPGIRGFCNSSNKSREVCKLNCSPDGHFYTFPEVPAWPKHMIRSRTAGSRHGDPESTFPGVNSVTQWTGDWTLTLPAITNLMFTPLPSHMLGAYRYKPRCTQLPLTGQPRLNLPSRNPTSWTGMESKGNVLVSFLQKIFSTIFLLF